MYVVGERDEYNNVLSIMYVTPTSRWSLDEGGEEEIVMIWYPQYVK